MLKYADVFAFRGPGTTPGALILYVGAKIGQNFHMSKNVWHEIQNV